MSSECGLLDLASCLPQKIFDFFINILNAPISPLLEFIKGLTTEPISLALFGPLWAIIIYILSLFYGILMLYSGFNFMFAGYDAVRRAKAKQWFLHVFLMIVLIQASFFLYSLVLEIESLLTAGVMNLVDDSFFLLTADNIVNIGLQFFFGLIYALTLLGTALLLVLRYLLIAFGVVFIPIGIFCYFIPPIKEYGKLIFNFLGVTIFTTFLSSIIYLVGSQIVELPIFENFKILIMIACFGVVNFLMFYLMFFSAIKSAFKAGESVAGTVVSVAKYFV